MRDNKCSQFYHQCHIVKLSFYNTSPQNDYANGIYYSHAEITYEGAIDQKFFLRRQEAKQLVQ